MVGDFFFAGRLVALDHGLGLYTLYFDLDRVHVAEAAVVERGGASRAAGGGDGPRHRASSALGRRAPAGPRRSPWGSWRSVPATDPTPQVGPIPPPSLVRARRRAIGR